MSFSDTIFLFFLALILFGPKKLPEIARQAGRLLAELRRASNEFRSQIESEIAHLELEKRQNASAQPSASASMSLSHATDAAVPRQATPVTLDALSTPEPDNLVPTSPSNPALPKPGATNTASADSGTPPVPTAESSAGQAPPTPQESHV